MTKLNNKRKYSGFSLLEVLVTLVILATGLLGLAGLQVTGLKNNHSAYHRTQATFLAYDIVDRMRANNAGIISYTGVGVAQASCFTVAGCTPAVMAGNDLVEWRAMLARILPQGTGTIALTGTTYTITISWDDNRDNTVDGNDPSFQMSFLP